MIYGFSFVLFLAVRSCQCFPMIFVDILGIYVIAGPVSSCFSRKPYLNRFEIKSLIRLKR